MKHTVLFPFILILAMVSCAKPKITAIKTITPSIAPVITPTPHPTAAPRDIPIYENSFENVTDVAANGITSDDANIRITTENVDYASGNKALEVSGILPVGQNPSLSVDLSIQKLIGEESLDLTDKTISFYAYLPVDSPFGNISIYAGRNGQFVFLGGLNSDDYWNKGAWHDYSFDLRGVQGLTSESDTLRIVGKRLTEGTTALAAYFLIDTLRWIRSDRFNMPINDQIDSLRKYAANKHFKFGLFSADYLVFGPQVNPWHVPGDPWYAYMVAQEGAVNAVEDFSVELTETGVQYFSPRPNEDYSNFKYDPVQDARILREYQFGKAYHMSTLGYGIGWFNNLAPQWMRDLDFPSATQALMLYHVERSLKYTKDTNPVWILFNESDDDQGTGSYFLKNRQGHDSDYSPWAANRTDSSLIKTTFIKANKVDPGATLILNDYSVEQIGLEKSEFFYNFASGLKRQGIPIHGVGFELHNSIDPDGNVLWCKLQNGAPSCTIVKFNLDTYLQNVDLNVKRYASVGMKVAFTEVEGQIKTGDIDLTSPAGRETYDKRLEWQAKYFAGLLKIALENENVIMYHMWGGTDRYQNGHAFPGYGNGFIFDKNYHPKPAYKALLELLKKP